MLEATCVPAQGMIPKCANGLPVVSLHRHGVVEAGGQSRTGQGAAVSASRSLSQPAPAAIQRLARRINGARKARGKRGQAAPGSITIVQT